jgi:hypothetical protein
MRLAELIAAFRALSADDQQRFRDAIKRGPGRPPKPIEVHSNRFEAIEKGKAALGTKAAAFKEQERREGLKAGSAKRRYDRSLDRLTADLKG